jgi:glycosyltransferase involved in cell wall biosynthesis
MAGRIAFVGAVAADQVPQLLNQHDVLLFPSRFEGFGLALVEAMAAGCVPVASRIRDVTDFIIENGTSGLLFPAGDIHKAADAIRRLAFDRELLSTLATAARSAARHFDMPLTAERYARLFRVLQTNPPDIAEPLRLDNWHYPKDLKPSWRRFIPQGIKDRLRILLEKSR